MKEKENSVKNYLIYAGISPEKYKLVEPEIHRENRNCLLAFSAVAVLGLMEMYSLSYALAGLYQVRNVFFSAMILALMLCLLTYCVKYEKRSWCMLFHVYGFVGIMFLVGILLGTVTRPQEPAVSFVALVLTVPLLFTDRPIRMCIAIFLGCAAFVVTAVWVKDREVLVGDLVNVCLYGSLSMVVCSYMMCLKCQRFLYAREVSRLSGVDLLTGLRNRNSYEWKLKTYLEYRKGLFSCVYGDINGLHELNNTKGHEAGDEMLRFVGKAMQEAFGEEHTFRIGGDEFVALIPGKEPKWVERQLETVGQRIEKASYHMSVGCAHGNLEETPVSELVSGAEKRMYEAKRAFYRQEGKDRRAR